MLYLSRERSSARSIIIQVKAWGSTTTQDISLPHDTDAFEELDTNRGLGWQYKLQQLKFSKRRSYEELEALELDRLRLLSLTHTTGFIRCEGRWRSLRFRYDTSIARV